MLEYTFMTFGALFAMVDPLGAVPAFLAMTPQNSAAERQRMALTATLVAGGVMAVFFVCLATVMALSYGILFVSAAGARRLSPTFMNIMERLMGILLAALGVQFILVGLKLG